MRGVCSFLSPCIFCRLLIDSILGRLLSSALPLEFINTAQKSPDGRLCRLAFWSSLLEAKKGASIESFGKRVLIAYVILLTGLWLIDSSLYPGTPQGIRAFISGFKWLVSVLLVVTAVAALVYLFIWPVIEILAITPMPQAHVSTSPVQDKRDEAERLHRIAEEEARKRKEDERIREIERRRAEEVSARARFHEMKRTRSATEAAKASLEEF